MRKINAFKNPKSESMGESSANSLMTKRDWFKGVVTFGLISRLGCFIGSQIALPKDAFAQPSTAPTTPTTPTVGASSSNLSVAQLTPFQLLFKEITNSQPVTQGGIVLETPRLADNGHSAALRVYVQSPMTNEDYVKSIYLLSDRNPRPFMGRFDLTPINPSAEISTRVRLNGSQNVYALALTSKGQWLSAHVPVEVTESACLDAS